MISVSEASGVRERYGVDDHVTRMAAGSRYHLIIESRYPKPGWKESSAGNRVSAPFPGSAVLFEGEYYEVQKINASPDAYRYYLSRWDERHPIRSAFEYSADSCARLAGERKSEHHEMLVRLLFPLLSPLAGALPARMQKAIERRLGFPAATMTTISALLFLLPGLYGSLLFLLSLVGAGTSLPGASGLLQILGPYLLLESGIRLSSSVHAAEPIGSLLAALPIAAWESVRRGKPAPAETTLEDLKTWVETFAPLWGLLGSSEQERLKQLYGFDAIKFTGWTTVILSLIAAINLFLSIFKMAAGVGTPGEAVWFILSLYFVLEGYSRWKDLGKSRPSGSLLGYLVRPLAAGLLKGPRAADSPGGGQKIPPPAEESNPAQDKEPGTAEGESGLVE